MISTRLSILMLTLFAASMGQAKRADRYSQTVLTFDSKREYAFAFDAREKALVLEIQKTTPSELSSLNYYDETVLRRVIVRDLGGSSVEIRMVMRDAKIRASVTDFDEPFRIVIDMFDDGFQQGSNPVTGIPELPNGKGIGPKLADSQSDLEVPSSEIPERLEDRNEDAPQPSNQAAAYQGKFKLLQPTPELMDDPNDVAAAANKVEAGLGKAWKEYPIYIYRVETAPFEGEPTRQAWLNEQSKKGLSNAQAAADFASKQFDFGHEGRALSAYQQALHREPSVFSRDVLHLWKLAEIQLGQGNLTLADGYYQSLIEKHPDSNLSGFAQVRRLDLAAIRAIRLSKFADLPSLAKRLDAISAKSSAELNAMKGLRKSYWNANGDDSIEGVQFGKSIPRVDPNSQRSLESQLTKVESSRTAFLVSSLLLHEMIASVPEWGEKIGSFAGDYFRKYFGAATEPYRSILKDELRGKLEKALEKQSADGRHALAIKNYEALPDALKSVQKNPNTAWALAESYRALGKLESSLKLYESAATSTDPQLKLKAFFWLGLIAGTLELDASRGQRGSERSQQFARQRSEADDAMRQTWTKMKGEEQTRAFTAMKDQLEMAIKDPSLLRTPPRIVLETYAAKLSTKTSATGAGETSNANSSFSASSQLVYLATSLAEKFGKLGLQEERRQSIALLKSVKPSELAGDEKAVKLWSQQLVTLADEFREANNYLEAGRLYAFAGSEGNQWDGRAESLFKGGLLLYRAGRRDEAVEAFRKASQDQGNRYYAEMAKERLEKLTQ